MKWLGASKLERTLSGITLVAIVAVLVGPPAYNHFKPKPVRGVDYPPYAPSWESDSPMPISDWEKRVNAGEIDRTGRKIKRGGTSQTGE